MEYKTQHRVDSNCRVTDVKRVFWVRLANFYIFHVVKTCHEKIKANSVFVCLSILTDFPSLSVALSPKPAWSNWRCKVTNMAGYIILKYSTDQNVSIAPVSKTVKKSTTELIWLAHFFTSIILLLFESENMSKC